jgi:hypothetical protein
MIDTKIRKIFYPDYNFIKKCFIEIASFLAMTVGLSPADHADPAD